mmetsp:Transcript_25039/g.71324  ORF Transcript_25039/g.71324 Transcript_25039/m.71324 type:complete len:224 (+) Transcript_25039:267-938(+)
MSSGLCTARWPRSCARPRIWSTSRALRRRGRSLPDAWMAHLRPTRSRQRSPSRALSARSGLRPGRREMHRPSSSRREQVALSRGGSGWRGWQAPRPASHYPPQRLASTSPLQRRRRRVPSLQLSRLLHRRHRLRLCRRRRRGRRRRPAMARVRRDPGSRHQPRRGRRTGSCSGIGATRARAPEVAPPLRRRRRRPRHLWRRCAPSLPAATPCRRRRRGLARHR